MKTSELTGAALDWAVAKCAGHQSRCLWMLAKSGWVAWQSYEAAWGNPIPDYCTAGGEGDRIVDREFISITIGDWDVDATPVVSNWAARSLADEIADSDNYFLGPTRLIAAMRCFVASKLGDEVEIPKELL